MTHDKDSRSPWEPSYLVRETDASKRDTARKQEVEEALSLIGDAHLKIDRCRRRNGLTEEDVKRLQDALSAASASAQVRENPDAEHLEPEE